MTYRLGIDIGGTFTDLVLVDEDGEMRTAKIPSIPEAPERAILMGLELLARNKESTVEELLQQCAFIVHGTTVCTNAVIQERWAKTGLLCTKGFRDTLEIREGWKEERYDWRYPPPLMLVPRYLRLPVEERISAEGKVLIPLNEDDVRRSIDRFKREGVESIAVCFLWSFMNSVHEKRVRQILEEEFPQAYLSISSEILPRLGEYNRTSSTVLNACLGPLMREYTDGLERFFRSLGYRDGICYMQCNAGIASGEIIKKKPIFALDSGPAAGPIAGLFFGRIFGYDNVITVDMGGTSFDVCLVYQGSVEIIKNRDVQRYRVGIPMVNVKTIGAGGGSIARIDSGGMLRVGPQSAGADPGPACYKKGGQEATVTDANVVLGYFNPEYLLGGRFPISAERSREAILNKIARPLQMNMERAALGVFDLVNANMVNGIRHVSLERGYDTRDFALVVGGGCSAAHVGKLAEVLQIPSVIIPKLASFFCAFGALVGDIRHDYSLTYAVKLSDVDLDKLERGFEEMTMLAYNDLEVESISRQDTMMVRTMDIRYLGEGEECTVVIPTSKVTRDAIAEIEELFHREHERLYTFADRGGVCELVNLGVTSYGKAESINVGGHVPEGGKDPSKAKQGERMALFEEYEDYVKTPVFDGSKLEAGNIVVGPAIVEEETTTIVVFPRWQLELKPGNVYMMTPR